MRQFQPSSFSLSFSNTEYSGPISPRKDLLETSTFTSCSFNTQGSWGGSIYFHDTSGSLTVTDSIFEKCNATSGCGGAIYGAKCGKIYISISIFILFSATNGVSGGSVFTDGVLVLPEVKECSFISCSGGSDGGGLYLLRSKGGINGVNLPVRACKFIGCISNKYTSGSTNDDDGGGLMYWANDFTFGVSNSIFSKCHSDLRAGALFLRVNSNYFTHIVRFCFFFENTAEKGNNALIHFEDSSRVLWDIVFMNSFTSDSDLSNSLVKNYAAATKVTIDWLPWGTLSPH